MEQPIYKVVYQYSHLLACGEYKGLKYAVVDYATHPCGYVESPAWKMGIENYDFISAHGGINYDDCLDHVKDLPEDFKDIKFIGWDYGHLGDYLPYYDDLPDDNIFKNGKKYTTEEIVADCHDVINQIVILKETKELEELSSLLDQKKKLDDEIEELKLRMGKR